MSRKHVNVIVSPVGDHDIVYISHENMTVTCQLPVATMALFHALQGYTPMFHGGVHGKHGTCHDIHGTKHIKRLSMRNVVSIA